MGPRGGVRVRRLGARGHRTRARSTTPPTPFPPSTVLYAARPRSPSEQMQIDHATIPAHTPSLLCVPPVCNTSLFCGDSHTMWTHNPGLCSSPGGRHPLSCL